MAVDVVIFGAGANEKEANRNMCDSLALLCCCC